MAMTDAIVVALRRCRGSESRLIIQRVCASTYLPPRRYAPVASG